MNQKIMKKYKSINEVSKLLNIDKHIIRYWDSKDRKNNKLRFEGISTRLKGNTRRHFSEKNIKKLEELKNILYQNGRHNYTLDLAKKIVSNKSLSKNFFSDDSGKKPIFNIDKLVKVSENLKLLLK